LTPEKEPKTGWKGREGPRQDGLKKEAQRVGARWEVKRKKVRNGNKRTGSAHR